MHRFSASVTVGIFAMSVLGFSGLDSGSTPVAASRPQSIADSVNRVTKGDRLNVQSAQSYQAWKDEFNARLKGLGIGPINMKKPDTALAPKEMPIGCEAAVSVALDDILAKIPSRCVSSLPGAGSFALLERYVAG